ncbi:ubiquinol-cytochrome c reductase iron-sulfur subunit [Agromyces sp. MMS24-JH15]|uniref:QcrA and Rieske domain-containing protein n=1 Tax=Agromyces sp. MMS24-JH15 TaxID=3243765 RepID=UPI0037486A1A
MAAENIRVTRRAALSLTGAGAAAVALAACTADTGQSNGSSSGSADGSGAIAALSEVPVGGGISATIDGQPALVAQPTAGKVVAFSAICTHQGCTVAPDGGEFHCPCHGSVYDLATGEVVNGPAVKALPAIAVRVEGDDIVAG